MRRSPSFWYALLSGAFLLLQGTSTLAARLLPSVDQALPWLLAATQMVPAHSLLHIATAVVALTCAQAGARAAWWFSLLFGSLYGLLGVLGAASHQALGLGLQPFDHPFHLLLGGLGLLAAWLARRDAARSTPLARRMTR